MYVTDNQKVRIRLAQVIDRIYFEQGNARRCHKWVYGHYARHILGVSYDTYLTYLHRPAEATIPDHIVEMFETAKALFEQRRGKSRTCTEAVTDCERDKLPAVSEAKPAAAEAEPEALR